MAATASQRQLPFHDFHNAVAGPALPLSRLSILALWRAAGRVPAPVGARVLPPHAARRLFVSRALPGTGLLLRRLSWQPGPVSPVAGAPSARHCPQHCPRVAPVSAACVTCLHGGCLSQTAFPAGSQAAQLAGQGRAPAGKPRASCSEPSQGSSDPEAIADCLGATGTPALSPLPPTPLLLSPQAWPPRPWGLSRGPGPETPAPGRLLECGCFRWGWPGHLRVAPSLSVARAEWEQGAASDSPSAGHGLEPLSERGSPLENAVACVCSKARHRPGTGALWEGVCHGAGHTASVFTPRVPTATPGVIIVFTCSFPLTGAVRDIL